MAAAQSAPQTAMQSALQAADGEAWQQSLLETLDAISAPLAVKMLSQINLGKNTTEPFSLLDQGCGMGVVASLLNETVPREVLGRCTVLCGDFSGPLVGFVSKRIEKEGWVSTRAEVVDAQVCDSGMVSVEGLTG